MNDAEYFHRRIALLRPRAKFVALTQSDTFVDKSANLGDGFHSVNLYDEKIDSNVITTPRGILLIQNTYLSSFSYNLLLCCLLNAETDFGVKNNESELKKLLKHNFKKYFAEQLFASYNNIFSRMLLLETLLYEQHRMIPVFEAKATDENLDRNANLASTVMSSLLSFHELGHFYLDGTPELWNEILDLHPDILPVFYKQVAETYAPQFVEEFRCDVISVISCLEQYKNEFEPGFCLRLIIFSFSTFAVLYSLTKSARKTAADQKSVPDEIDFQSIEKKHIDFEYTLGLDFNFIERTKLVKKFCELFAEKAGIQLYGNDCLLPFDTDILEKLLEYVELVMEVDDPNARRMSLLAAEAFHLHEKGAEFLYLRSKTFVFGKDRNPDGSIKIDN